MIPSLLYFDPPATKPLSPELFDDLQLTQLMPSCPFDAALFPCEQSNLTQRQAIFVALEDNSLREALKTLRTITAYLTDLYEAHANASCTAEGNVIFAAFARAALDFATHAAALPKNAPLLTRFADHFAALAASDAYLTLQADLDGLKTHLSEIASFGLLTHGKQVTLSREQPKTYISRLEDCGARLGLAPMTLRRPKPRSLSPDLVCAMEKLCPDAFAAFDAFAKKHTAILSPDLPAYHPQLGFYLEMAAMFDRVKEKDIPLVYPTVSEEKLVRITDAYDISLLAKNAPFIVPNSIDFDPESPFFYLTGANGGGKTTYLRTVGIAMTLFLLGAPVAAKSATCYVPSSIFTHFPHDERFDGSGRFVEEHRRVQTILETADESALILLNETYSTTNEENAVAMTVKLAEEVFSRGNFGLYITHQHALGKTEIPYLNVVVDTENDNRRTYKILRMKGKGSSFAEDILKKYDLTPEALTARFPEKEANA